MSLRFDEDARHEYLEAIGFYGRAAERFVQAVDAAIAQIHGDPERFREVEPGVRSCRVQKFPYSILYTRDDQGSEILTSFRINLSLFGEKSGGDLWSGKGSLTL